MKNSGVPSEDRGRTQRNHVTALPSLDARQTYLANSYPQHRKLERIVENAGGAVVKLSAEEIKAIDEALDKLPKSDIFGVKNN